MATIDLANFLPQADGPSTRLTGGHSVPFVRRRLNSGSATMSVAPPTGDLRWFEIPAQLTDKLPLRVSPSESTPVAASVVDSVQIGTRIAINRASDPATLGCAVHASLAAFLSSEDVSFSSNDVKAILDRTGVAGALSADALLGQFLSVRQWLKTRWPDAKILVEIPVTQLLGNGQVMSGRVDLLLKTDNGWILIDYKSGAQNSSQWEILAATYGGQLAAYSAAIEAATGISVLESWLVLLIAGTALKVESAAAQIIKVA
jgi:hypothetical protein